MDSLDRADADLISKRAATVAIELLEPRRLLAAYAFNDLEAGIVKDIGVDGGVLGSWDLSVSLKIGVWHVGRRGRVGFTELGGLKPSGAFGSFNLTEIDANGLVSGQTEVGPGFTQQHAVVWAFTEGVGYLPIDLGTLSGSSASESGGMNDLGHIVGNSAGHAFLSTLRRGVASTSDINSFAPAGITLTAGHDINNSDAIIGDGGPGGAGAFYLKPRKRGLFTFVQVGGLDNTNPDTTLNRLSNTGAAVGISMSPATSTQHAILFRLDAIAGAQIITDLGVLPGGSSVANDITDTGVIVGKSTNSSAQSFGYIWRPRAKGRYTAVNLNTEVTLPAGWVITEARGINEAGQIAVNALDASQHPRAMLLTPIAVAQPAIARPAAALPTHAPSNVATPFLAQPPEDAVWNDQATLFA